MKKLIYLLCIVALGAVIAHRASNLASESRRQVFNITRAAAESGIPVDIVIARKKTDVLREPLHIKDGRAFVSAARVGKFKPGQKTSAGGSIISVSSRIDLNTGLYEIRASGPGGNVFVEIEHAGIFLPVDAVRNGIAKVYRDGVARAKEVKLIASDSGQIVVTGIVDGDAVILSDAEDGIKVRGRR